MEPARVGRVFVGGETRSATHGLRILDSEVLATQHGTCLPRLVVRRILYARRTGLTTSLLRHLAVQLRHDLAKIAAESRNDSARRQPSGAMRPTIGRPGPRSWSSSPFWHQRQFLCPAARELQSILLCRFRCFLDRPRLMSLPLTQYWAERSLVLSPACRSAVAGDKMHCNVRIGL